MVCGAVRSYSVSLWLSHLPGTVARTAPSKAIEAFGSSDRASEEAEVFIDVVKFISHNLEFPKRKSMVTNKRQGTSGLRKE